MNIAQKVLNTFKSRFNAYPEEITSAPGRINLIGEHLDYNGGKVMPMAIDKKMVFALSKNLDAKLVAFSVDLNSVFEAKDINKVYAPTEHWQKYFFGVISEFKLLGYTFSSGLSICFGSDIPIGAGLSSSAALSVAFAFGINKIFEFNLSKLQIAQLAQVVEHKYIGVQCGMMDMFTSVFSKKNKIIQLDCIDLNYELINFKVKPYTLVLVNSMVKHSLAESAYNQRKAEAVCALQKLKELNGEILNYRNVTSKDISDSSKILTENEAKRARFIVDEIERVSLCQMAIGINNFETVGEILTASHAGLRELYQVSCIELDFLVDHANILTYVFGARMMGGGFGGCTLNLINDQKIDQFKMEISKNYVAKFGITPEIYLVESADGVKSLA